MSEPNGETGGPAGVASPAVRHVSDPAGGRGEARRPTFDMLRWIYLARVGLAGGLFVGAAFAWTLATPTQTLTVSLAVIVTLILTPASYWYTHVFRRQPGLPFLMAQALLDVVLVTLTVHVTGGREGLVAPLYIPLIAAYTLLLPLLAGFFFTAVVCLAFIADVVWAEGTAVDVVVALQLAIFVAIAVLVGWIATKLRETGAELSSVESALEQLRLETDDILGNIPTAVLTVDGYGRLAYANPAAEALLGIDGRAWLDQPFMDELRRRSPGLYQALERTRSHRIPVASAEIGVLREREKIPVGVSTALLERREGPPSVTAIMRDISDVKRLDRLRQRTERLEAVAELSASLAHEIKNPLASISSSVQQLDLSESADEDDKLLTRLIVKESERLSRLLSDFIDFARVHIERKELLDLRETVRHAVNVVSRHPAFREEVEITSVIDDAPVVIEGDEDLLHRVITNLLLNAVQAAPDGRPTSIRVELSRLSKLGAPHGLDIPDPVMLRVIDDGPGIAEADLERVFDPFFSRRQGGTGLGLAIVHRAVREHQGTVLVESEPGAGTRFTVYLPGTTGARNPTAVESR